MQFSSTEANQLGTLLLIDPASRVIVVTLVHLCNARLCIPKAIISGTIFLLLVFLPVALPIFIDNERIELRVYTINSARFKA